MKLTKVEGPSERVDVWWDVKLPWIGQITVSCPKCGFMTCSMNPEYTEYATRKGGKFICPNCRETTVIKLD